MAEKSKDRIGTERNEVKFGTTGITPATEENLKTSRKPTIRVGGLELEISDDNHGTSSRKTNDKTGISEAETNKHTSDEADTTEETTVPRTGTSKSTSDEDVEIYKKERPELIKTTTDSTTTTTYSEPTTSFSEENNKGITTDHVLNVPSSAKPTTVSTVENSPEKFASRPSIRPDFDKTSTEETSAAYDGAEFGETSNSGSQDVGIEFGSYDIGPVAEPGEVKTTDRTRTSKKLEEEARSREILEKRPRNRSGISNKSLTSSKKAEESPSLDSRKTSKLKGSLATPPSGKASGSEETSVPFDYGASPGSEESSKPLDSGRASESESRTPTEVLGIGDKKHLSHLERLIIRTKPEIAGNGAEVPLNLTDADIAPRLLLETHHIEESTSKSTAQPESDTDATTQDQKKRDKGRENAKIPNQSRKSIGKGISVIGSVDNNAQSVESVSGEYQESEGTSEPEKTKHLTRPKEDKSKNRNEKSELKSTLVEESGDSGETAQSFESDYGGITFT